MYNFCGFIDRLEHLYLGGNHLVTLPPNVGNLQKLLSLVLCDNRLASLPAELVQLKQLRSLSLHNNHLTILPPEIITLTELCELSLRGNPLVVRFVRDLTWNPPTLLELAARCVKNNQVHYTKEDLPGEVMLYLDSARHCLNPKCYGRFSIIALFSVRENVHRLVCSLTCKKSQLVGLHGWKDLQYCMLPKVPPTVPPPLFIFYFSKFLCTCNKQKRAIHVCCYSM